MSTKSELIERAIDLLIQVGNVNPRDAVIRDLKAIADEPDAPGVGDIELVATIQPGGKFVVRSLDGRLVKGVKAVACYPDERTGAVHMQITL